MYLSIIHSPYKFKDTISFHRNQVSTWKHTISISQFIDSILICILIFYFCSSLTLRNSFAIHSILRVLKKVMHDSSLGEDNWRDIYNRFALNIENRRKKNEFCAQLTMQRTWNIQKVLTKTHILNWLGQVANLFGEMYVAIYGSISQCLLSILICLYGKCHTETKLAESTECICIFCRPSFFSNPFMHGLQVSFSIFNTHWMNASANDSIEIV